MLLARKVLSCVLVTVFLFTSIVVKAQKTFAYPDNLPEINCIDAKLPLTFSWINYEDPTEDVPPIVENKVHKIIVDFYLESTGGDSAGIAKAKDCYFNTLRIPFNGHQLFIVILKTPLSYSHCKLFLYDSASNSVSKTTVDYNTWSMYSIDENIMKRSELFKQFHLNSDDILLKKQSLLLKRLKHNGDSSELEETIYRPNGLSLDTVSSKSEILYAP